MVLVSEIVLEWCLWLWLINKGLVLLSVSDYKKHVIVSVKQSAPFQQSPLTTVVSRPWLSILRESYLQQLQKELVFDKAILRTSITWFQIVPIYFTRFKLYLSLVIAYSWRWSSIHPSITLPCCLSIISLKVNLLFTSLRLLSGS